MSYGLHVQVGGHHGHHHRHGHHHGHHHHHLGHRPGFGAGFVAGAAIAAAAAPRPVYVASGPTYAVVPQHVVVRPPLNASPYHGVRAEPSYWAIIAGAIITAVALAILGAGIGFLNPPAIVFGAILLAVGVTFLGVGIDSLYNR